MALVTGASSGIGRALAGGLAEAGAKVAVHGRDRARIAETCQRIAEKGGDAWGIEADLAEVPACQEMVGKVHERFNRIDILINCAGMNRRKPIKEATVVDFDRIVSLNLRSIYFVSQAAQEIMRRQGGGKIINIGSITSTEGLGAVSIYGATKAAVAQLTRTMALEWAEENIQVNCLAPGFMMTPLTEVGLFGNAKTKQWILDRIPMKRPGRADELVAMALLLASEGSSYITGQIFNVDGGYLAGGSWLSEPRPENL